jgi:hypothetical protein
MLASDVVLIDYVFLSNWYEANLLLMVALGAYTLLALGLSMWGGPAREDN